MATIEKYLSCSIKDIPRDDIIILLKSLKEEMKSRRSVDDLMKELKRSFKAIDWGYGDWKSEKTSDAVSKVEELAPLEAAIHEAILAMTDDVEKQWEAALAFSLQSSGMISEVEDYAGKLVNGSCGEWCPETASSIESLWEELASNENRPSEATIENVCRKLKDILGDYENGLHETLSNIQAPNSDSRSNKRQKMTNAEIVDLTS